MRRQVVQGCAQQDYRRALPPLTSWGLAGPIRMLGYSFPSRSQDLRYLAFL